MSMEKNPYLRNFSGKLMLLDIVEDPSAFVEALKPTTYTGPTGQPFANKEVSRAGILCLVAAYFTPSFFTQTGVSCQSSDLSGPRG